MGDPLEISGDIKLSMVDRLRYLGINIRRNLAWARPLGTAPRFVARREPSTAELASPGRASTEAWVRRRLPILLAPGRPLTILEIGCGSGRMARMLAEMGYRGAYHGIDIGDRFNMAPIEGLAIRFTQSDIHAFDPGGQRFDLILSISALEHIPEDRKLLAATANWLTPGGVEVHVVPSGWGLAVYLWHGYRQYTLARIKSVFHGSSATVEPLGGLPSFLLHLGFITLGELLLKLRLRNRFPALYAALLDRTLPADASLPWTPTMHVMWRRGSTEGRG